MLGTNHSLLVVLVQVFALPGYKLIQNFEAFAVRQFDSRPFFELFLKISTFSNTVLNAHLCLQSVEL